jgi:hypothetical protein
MGIRGHHTMDRRQGWTGHLWQRRFASFAMDEPNLVDRAELGQADRDQARPGVSPEPARKAPEERRGGKKVECPLFRPSGREEPVPMVERWLEKRFPGTNKPKPFWSIMP